MPDRVLPRYPVYVPSRGRVERAKTLRNLAEDGVPHYLVVEPQEETAYRERYPAANVLVLPESDQGLPYVRNWIKQHSTDKGDARHWQLDDNMRHFYRFQYDKRLPCRAGVALRVCEDFADRYTNVGLAGLNYDTFVRGPMPPFSLNVHVYSCTLVNNELPYKWRLPQNDDVDICLQVLSGGWCTVLLNAFLCGKERTMTVPGGMGELYDGDGRMKGARILKRMWPGIVDIDRRFDRPHFVIKYAWRKFDTPLKRRKDIDWNKQKTNNYGMKLKTVREIQSEYLKRLVDEQ